MSLSWTRTSCFSRHGVLDIVIARTLYMIAHARVLLMIVRLLCIVFFSSGPYADRDT